jgi:hypothetical protein
MDLRIIFFQSLVLGLCVAAEKRERERTKEVPTVQKNLAAETKDKKREEKSEYSCCYSTIILFILCDYICVLARISKQA